MADINPLPPALPLRPSAAYQVSALAPYIEHSPREAPWQLNRKPFDFPSFTLFGWQREDIPIGEALPEAQAALIRAPSTGAPRAFGPPQTLGWSWALQAIGAVGSISAITSDAIPWPFRITGFSIDASDLAVPANKQAELQLLTVDEDIGGTLFTIIEGEALIPRLGGSGVAGTAYGLRIKAVTNATASTQQNANNAAAAAIGRTCMQSGKRICIAIKQSDALTASFHGHLTVEQFGGTADVISRAIGAPRAVSGIPAPRRAPAPVAAPSRQLTPVGAARVALNAERASRGLAPLPTLPDSIMYLGGGAPYSSGGARAITAEAGDGILQTRWVLDEYPGRDWATAAEATLYAEARQVSALPTAQRAAAAEAVRRAAGQLIYGEGELATPIPTILSGIRAAPGAPVPIAGLRPRRPTEQFQVAGLSPNIP